MSRLDQKGNYKDIVGELRRTSKIDGMLYSRRLMLNQAADELEAANKAEAMMRDEITRLRSELANARNAALEEAAKLVEEGFDRPGVVKKQDACAHGKFGWEDCEQCAVIAIRATKTTTTTT